MRVGIMGGTLDPVHLGHVQAAKAALDMLKLDRVMLLPAGDPPHKHHPTLKTDRLQMVRLAAEEIDGLFPCSIEIFRDGTTYTVDTLRQLRENNPNVEWYYIIGADTLDVLDTWRSFDEVAKLCTFIVIGRADADANQACMRRFAEQYGAKFIPLDFNGPDISSSEIRRRVKYGESIADMVPTSVGNYITDHSLYICNYSRNEIKAKLQAALKPGRYIHTLGVADTARRLAPRYGVNPARAEIAALLHDCAKYMSIEEMRALVTRYVPDADVQEMETISVLHAPAGAVHAALEYGVKDREILSAIRKHTLGDRNMSPLEALIYTADFIEPGREDFPGLSEARVLAEKDIFRAANKCAELTNSHLLKQGRQPHPRSLAMLENTALFKKEEKL